MYTDLSPLLCTNSAPTAPVLGYLLALYNRAGGKPAPYGVGTGEYTPVAHVEIVEAYPKHATDAGLDWVLVMAQCFHETGNLSSWWAGRPRRNPAGIAVNGTSLPGTTPGVDKNWYALSPTTGNWQRGISYPSWQEASRAHVGLLLKFALHDNELNAVQQAYAERAPRTPAHVRGCAKLLRGLNGTWAWPGRTYAAMIAVKANNILKGV